MQGRIVSSSCAAGGAAAARGRRVAGCSARRLQCAAPTHPTSSSSPPPPLPQPPPPVPARATAAHGAPSQPSRPARHCAPSRPRRRRRLARAPGLPRYAVRTQRPRLVRVPRTYSTRGRGGKPPCASGTYPTREAGTRSPYVPNGGAGAYVSAQAATLLKMSVSSERTCKWVGRQNCSLRATLEGWLVDSKGLGRCPGSDGAPWAVRVTGRAVGRCRCRGRPSSQPA